MNLLKLTMIFFMIAILFQPLFNNNTIHSKGLDTTMISHHSNIQIKTKNGNFQPITKKDDAFHGTTPHPSMEWWYFDGILNDNYSIHIGFRILSFQNFQMLKPSINIYHNSNLIAHETTMIPKKYFFTSEIIPLLTIKNKPAMKVQDSNTNNTDYWTYNIDSLVIG